MNYIQIEIGGKLRGWKATQLTLEIWSKKTLHDFNATSSNYAAVYAGLVANCYVKEEEFTKTVEVNGLPVEVAATFEDVCEWVDGLKDKNVLSLVKKTFEESQYYIELLESMENALKASKKDPENKKKAKVK